MTQPLDFTDYRDSEPQVDDEPGQLELFERGPKKKQTKGPRGVDPWQQPLFPKDADEDIRGVFIP